MIDSDLGALAFAAEAARGACAQAAAALEEPQRHHDTLVTRLAELAERRRAIVARRARGDNHADDGAVLELAAVDSGNLTALLRTAEQALATVRAAHQAAAAAVQSAESAYASAENRARLAALDNHADALLERLVETIYARGAVAAALPTIDRDLSSIIRHGQKIEALLLSRIRAARVVSKPIPVAGRPLWRVSDDTFSEIERLVVNGGRLI